MSLTRGERVVLCVHARVCTGCVYVDVWRVGLWGVVGSSL